MATNQKVKSRQARKPKISNSSSKPVNTKRKGKVQGYLYNVGKSVTYAAMDKVKEMNPVLCEFSEKNNDLFKVIYKSAIDYRTTYKRGLEAVKRTKFYEAAQVGMVSLKEDIKTGNLYNKEREEKYQLKAMGMTDEEISGSDMDINLDDWGSFDDNWDDWGDEDFTTESVDSTQLDNDPSNGVIVESLEATSAANANAISMAMARSAEYTAEVSIKNTNLLYTENVKAFGLMNGHLDAVNQNVGSIMQYLDNNVTTHLSNSTEFFTQATQALQDQTALLREIAENTRKEVPDEENQNNKKKLGYNDIVDASGLPDIFQYGKKIKKNTSNLLNEKSGGTANMLLNGLGDDGNMLAAFAANPYGELLKYMVGRMVPSNIDKLSKDLNKSFGGFFASLITRFNTMAEDENASLLSQSIGKIFGIRTSKKYSIDSSKYDKGKVDWDGASRKALTEIIPNQLGKIVSILTGEEESVYDYEKGQFVTLGELQKSYDNKLDSFYKSAGSDLMSEIYRVADENITFKDNDDFERFTKDVERLIKSLYDRNQLLDVNNKELSSKWNEYGVQEKNLAIIQAIVQNLDNHYLHEFNVAMNETYSRQNDEMTRLEKSGRFNVLFNNNGSGVQNNAYANKIGKENNKHKKNTLFNTNILIDTKDGEGRNIFWYLKNMYFKLDYLAYSEKQNVKGSYYNNSSMNNNNIYRYNSIFDTNGNLYHKPYDQYYYNYDGYTKPDIKTEEAKRYKKPETIKREEKQRANERYIRNQQKRLEKEQLLNVGEYDDEEIYARVKNQLRFSKTREDLEKAKNKLENPNLLEKIMKTKDLSEKTTTFLEKTNDYLKKPMKFVEDVLTKADQRLFELIYGKEGIGKQKDITGFLDAMLFEMRKSFKHFRYFMDENILNPLKDNLGLDKEKSLFKGLMEKFGITDKKNDIKDAIKSAFSGVGSSLKNIAKNVEESVVDTLGEIFDPMIGKIKSKDIFKQKEKEKKENDVEEESTSSYVNSSNTIRYILDEFEESKFKNANAKDRIQMAQEKLLKSSNNRLNTTEGKAKYIIEKSKYIREKTKALDDSIENSQAIKKANNYRKDIIEYNKEYAKLTNRYNAISNQMRKNPPKEIEEKYRKEQAEISNKLNNIGAKRRATLNEYNQILKDNPNISYDDMKSYDEALQNINTDAELYINPEDKQDYYKANIMTGLTDFMKSDEFKNMSLEDRREFIDKNIFAVDKSLEKEIEKYKDIKADYESKDKQLAVGKDGKELYYKTNVFETVTNPDGSKSKVLKHKKGDPIYNDYSYQIRETDSKIAELEARRSDSNSIKFNMADYLNAVRKYGIMDTSDNNFIQSMMQLVSLNNKDKDDIDFKNQVDKNMKAKRYLQSIDKNNPLYGALQSQIRKTNANLWDQLYNRIPMDNLQTEDIYGLFGLNMRYDKDFKQSMLENFEKSYLDQDSKALFMDLVQSHIENSDTNDIKAFEDFTINDLLYNIDNVLDKKKQSKQKIQEGLSLNPKSPFNINRDNYANMSPDMVEKALRNSPAGKRLAIIDKEIDEFSNSVDKLMTIFDGLNIDTIGDMSVMDFLKDRKREEKSKSEDDKKDKEKKMTVADGYRMGESQFLSNPKFMQEYLEEDKDNTTNIVQNTNDILLELRDLVSSIKNNNLPSPSMVNSPYENSIFGLNPFINISSSNEQQVLRNTINGLQNEVNSSIYRYFSRNPIRGYADGGHITKDQLAIVGKGEQILTFDEKMRQAQANDEAKVLRTRNITGYIADMIKGMNTTHKNKSIHDKAKYLYSRIAEEYGSENIDPNIIIGLLRQANDAGQAFYDLETENEQKEVIEMFNIMEHGFNQRNQGIIDNYGIRTEKGNSAEYENVFSNTFKVYQRTINKTLASVFGDDPEKDRKITGDALENVLKEAKVYRPDLIAGGLIGGGVSLLTGLIGGPLLGAAVGAGVALTKNSQSVQNMLFGEQELDKDGNVIGRKGRILPKDLVNKVSQVFPDLKKFGIIGALSGLLPITPFGPVPGLFLGSVIAFAKNSSIVQDRLFGDVGGFDKDKFNEFKTKKLPSILASAGIGGVASILGLTGPFGLVGSALIGSTLGFASTSEKFQNIIFGEYDKTTGTYNGGVIPYIRKHVFDPIVDKGKSTLETFFGWIKRDIISPVLKSLKPITKWIQEAIKSIASGITNWFKELFKTKFTRPIIDTIKKIANVITAPFRTLGKKLLRGVGKVISAPFRMIGATGRAARRDLIRKGKADDMTAQERLDYMKNESENEYFYNQAIQQRNTAETQLGEEVSNRFGAKTSAKLQAMLAVGAHGSAEKLINKSFGDIKDDESIKIRNRMLESINLHRDLKGGRLLDDTYEERLELGNKIKEQYIRGLRDYNNNRSEEDQITLNDYIQMNDPNAAKYFNNSYEGDKKDKLIAASSNEDLQNIYDQYQITKLSDREYEKGKKERTKEIRNIARKNLDSKTAKYLGKILNTGDYENGIAYLNLAMQAKGVEADKYQTLNQLRESISEFKTHDELRRDLVNNREDLYSKLTKTFGEDVDEETIADYMRRVGGELKRRKAKGTVITNEDRDKEELAPDIRKINEHVKQVTDLMDKSNTTINDILNFMQNNFANTRYGDEALKERDMLDARVYRNEQSFTQEEKEKQKQLRRLGYNYNSNTLPFLMQKSSSELKDMADNDEILMSDENKDLLKFARQKGYNTIPPFMKNMSKDQLNKLQGKGEDDTSKESLDSKPKKLPVINTRETVQTTSTLDDEGNEVVMKKDTRTGDMEADLSDTSTRKSIATAKRVREKQEHFYDSFLNLFKMNDKEDKEEKKNGGWISKLLMALGLGKSLIGKAKGLLGGVLGKGLLGSLFTRGIFGALGKGALAIGGLMYLPEIIDLFKTRIAPAVSETWQTTLKPWLLKDGIPRLKQGVSLLIKELPALIVNGIKFTVTELIPTLGKSILKALGWDIKDSDPSPVQYSDGSSISTSYDENGNIITNNNINQQVQYQYDENGDIVEVPTSSSSESSNGSGGTSPLVIGGNYLLRKSVRSGAKYAAKAEANVLESLAKNGFKDTLEKSATKEGSKELMEGAIKESTKKSGKDIFKSTLKGMSHPLRTSAKGLSKGTNFISNTMGKDIGKAFLKLDGSRIAKSGNKEVAQILTNLSNNSIIGRFITGLKNQFIKLFTNPVIVKMLGTGKGGVSVAKAILENFCPNLLKAIANAAKSSTKALTRLTSVVGTGGLATIAFGVYDFISGFNDARNILGVTEDKIGLGARIASGLVKTIQGLSIIATLVPTSMIMKFLISCLSAIGIDMTGIQEQQEKAQEELAQYNSEHGTTFSLEEYNKEVKGHKGIFTKLKDTTVGGFKWVGNKISNLLGLNKSTESDTQNQFNNTNASASVRSYGKGEGDTPKTKDELVAKNANYNDITSEQFQTSSKQSGIKIFMKKLVKGSIDNGRSMANLLEKIKSIIQYILNSATIINLLGTTNTGESVAKVIYNNFIPKFIQEVATRLNRSSAELINSLASRFISRTIASWAFLIGDFVNGFTNAENILSIVSNATFIEKIIAGMLEAIKGLSLLTIVPTNVVVELLFDSLSVAGIKTDIQNKRNEAKKIVAEYNKKNGTSYTITDYNREEFGRKNIFEKIGDKFNSVFNTKQDLNNRVNNLSSINNISYGYGDIINGNPYFSQKEATGGLSKMISDSGCGPTATAMALSKVTGQQINPEQIASNALKTGSWDSEGARGAMFSSEASRYGVKTIDAGGDFDKFDKLVSAGIPTAVSGTYGKGDSPYTSAGHIVTVFGKDKNGNYLVNDPRGEKYSKAYTKEELMNGFRNSWSFGKGEDDVTRTTSVLSSKEIFSSAKSLDTSSIGGKLYKKSSNAMNIVNQSIKDTGLIESASKVIEETFIKIFNNETIINLLGNASGSQYSASSMLLANFVPQVVKKLKQNCENYPTNNLSKYLRAIINNSNVENISFLINDFVSAFNNPSASLGKFDTFTIGMKVCAGIMAIVNNRFVVDKILTASDWITLIEDYVMPVFGESDNDLKSIKSQADKLVKTLKSNINSLKAREGSLQSISESGSSDISGSLFNKIGSTFSSALSSLSTKMKSVASGVGNVVNNVGSTIGNVFSGALSWFKGLFGKGEYVGRGKNIHNNRNVSQLNNSPYYSQYGNYDKPSLSESGCGPTSTAMVLSKITGKDITPDKIANEAYSAGYYNNNGSTRGLFPYIGNKYGVKVQSESDFDKVKKYAANGVPMVISGKGGQLYGDNSSGHIVASFGKSKDGYLINDPSNSNKTLYNESSLRTGFKEAWIFGDQNYLNNQIIEGDFTYDEEKDLKETLALQRKFSKNNRFKQVYNKLQTRKGLLKSQSMGKGKPKDETSDETDTEYTGTDYKKGETAKASFSAYYPSGNKLQGGYYDENGNLLDPSKQTCAAPKEVPIGTKILISDTGTYLDGKVYTVTNTGGSLTIKSDGTYKINILVANKKEANSFSNPKGNITFMGEDGDSINVDTSSSDTTTGSLSGGFFEQMATAFGNFSKKLFGFDIEVPVNSGTTTDSGGYTTAQGNTVAEKIFNFCKSKMLSDAATAGVMGNAWCESTFNPAATGKDSNYDYFGLFQWMDNYGQKEALNKIASDLGTTWTDPNAQLNYMWSQLTTNVDGARKVWLQRAYPGQGLEGFKNETNAYTAGVKFNKFFEIGLGDSARGNAAKTIFNGYIKNGQLVDIDRFVKTGKGEDKSNDVEGYQPTDEELMELFGTGNQVKLGSKLIEYALSFVDKGFTYSQANRYDIDNNGKRSDCSSFTNHIYDRAAGVDIGARSINQYTKEGSLNIDQSGLAPSDVLLFKNTTKKPSPYKDGVSHAALYVGDNKFVHSGTKGIKVADLSTNYWQEHFLTGKRFVNPNLMVDGTISNPNKNTNFTTATGSYTIPDNLSSGSLTGDGSSTSETTSAPGFFEEMATAVSNFAKKLFGFDIEETSTASSGSLVNSNGTVGISATSEEFDKAVHMGDSITYALKSSGAVPSSRVVATSGDTAAKGIKNADAVIAKKPPMVILNYGTNDGGYISGWDKEYLKKWFTENYGKLISKLKAGLPNAKIVLNQIWDANDKNFQKGIQELQPLMSSIASNNGAGLVDCRDINKEKDYHMSDGIHFNPPFQKLWVESLRNKLVSAGTGKDPFNTKDIDRYFEDTLNATKSSEFGIRDDEFHTGVDYAADEDTPILSPISGKVVENLNDDKYGFGNTLVIRDKKGADHRFAHMRDQSRYGLGSKIRKNDIIGSVGSTGRSTGSHLHYEVSKKGTSINPNKYHESIGGTKNSLDKVTLSFPESNQKIDATISNSNKELSQDVLIRLINIIITLLTKVSDNTENIQKIVDSLNELKFNNNYSSSNNTNSRKTTVNKSTSDTEKSKSNKLLNVLQQSMNSDNFDITNTQSILDILERLATE